MNFHKEYLKLSERVIKINRHLAALELPVILVLNKHTNTQEYYIFLRHINKELNDFSIKTTNSKEQIIEAAKELSEPKFVPITTLCINMVGEQFWLDKETLVTVEAITREGILLSDNSIVDQSRLFIKE